MWCRLLLVTFVALYLMALGLLAVGTFGLFGGERDPLAAVFLLPLGLPWQLWIDHAADPLWPWLAMLAPLVNLLLLAGCCYCVRLYRTRHHRREEPASNRNLE